MDALSLARAALDWLPDPTEPSPWDADLYTGTAGVVFALLEGYHHFGDERYADAAVRGARVIADAVDETDNCSLYFGRTGMALALHEVGARLGEPTRAATKALDLVRDRFDGERWGDQFELLGGNAGIALGALQMGDLDLALTAVTPYLRLAETTPGGVHWEVRAGMPARFHHISHGTLGIVSALAAVGHRVGRPDLIELALAGAADVLSRNEAGPDGFLVPHSDPQHRPELIERYSFGWCHGPAGDAQTFRLLAAVTGDATWTGLVDRCRYTIVGSGLPQRLRPGFWDNNGRCCGTAGVLALACDLIAAGRTDVRPFAETLVADLGARATIDGSGARWSNVEHRVTPSDLPPQPGWAMGNAGIARELLRYARVTTGQARTIPSRWPDQLPTT